jgi:hypothetical protein
MKIMNDVQTKYPTMFENNLVRIVLTDKHFLLKSVPIRAIERKINQRGVTFQFSIIFDPKKLITWPAILSNMVDVEL